MNSRKKVKGQDEQLNAQKIQKIYQLIRSTCIQNEKHPFEPIMKRIESEKHPILPTLNHKSDIYKTNPDRKKKPFELYLDTVNNLYKKKDLDILINPLSYSSVFENWAPREIAIFEEGILKFGKQFEFISELIETKSAKQVYEFYIEWKTTSHYKSFKAAQNSGNRGNLEDII